MSKDDSKNLIFFLGGRDLEMLTISELLEIDEQKFHDKNLAWGAKASAYRAEIKAAMSGGATPVLVELDIDFELPDEKIIVIDHHGERAGARAPTSLEQVFALLELSPTEWTRRFELVAANDKGYIPAMLEAGATREEIEAIRRADRRAQNLTETEERQAIEALENLQTAADGKLTVAFLPHSRAAPLCDRLEPALGGQGFQNLLIRSPRQLNFYGAGEIVFALKDKFPASWYGGSLPERGFWGSETAQFEAVRDFIVSRLCLN